MVIDVLILIFELMLYYKICNLLKKELNYYYERKKRDLLILTIVSIMFFVIRLILLYPTKFFNGKPDSMIYLDNYHMEGYKYSVIEFVFVMFIDILSYLPLFFHVYFNIGNINFKVYLQEVLKGYSLEHQYKISSGFIYVKERSNKPCVYKTANNHSSDNSESQSFLIEGTHPHNQSEDSESSISREKFKIEYMRIKNMERASTRNMNSNDL